MNCVRPLQGLLLLLAITGCGKDSDSNDTESNVTSENNSDADWEELGEDDGSSEKEDDWDGDWDEKEDGEDDTGKNSDTCGEDVIAGEPCSGGWEETWCFDEDGVSWWCDESGVWTSDK